MQDVNWFGLGCFLVSKVNITHKTRKGSYENSELQSFCHIFGRIWNMELFKTPNLFSYCVYNGCHDVILLKNFENKGGNNKKYFPQTLN